MSDKIVDIPDEVEAAVEVLEQARCEAKRREERRQEAISEKERRIDQLRDDRADELREAAAFVFRWAKEFIESDVGQRITKLNGPRGYLPIFIARFWLGEPQPESTRTVWANLELREIPGSEFEIELRYAEYHKGHMISHTEITFAPKLWQVVHPDFLARCAAHLKSDEAFEYILRELERRAPSKP